MNRNLYIGLMSGTSIDAIDAALVNFDDHHVDIKATYSHEIPQAVRDELHSLTTPGDNELDRLGELDTLLGRLYSEAVNTLLSKANIDRNLIKGIGCHGQTIRHRPNAKYPFTLQIGDPNIVAELTGITTVSDFRRRDMANGGQGAPLAPAFHQWLLQDEQQDCFVVNIGGIANLTYLSSDGTCIGFDTGPGNTLMDQWIKNNLNKNYDDDGKWAKSGKVNQDLLSSMLRNNYFTSSAPKSTGREYFNLQWLESYTKNFKLNAEDIQATLLELTTVSICDEIKKLRQGSSKVFVCGGGAYNKYLLERIEFHLSEQSAELSIETSASFGIEPEWLEAVCFAWFAKQTLEGNKLDFQTITGANKAAVYGGIYQA